MTYCEICGILMAAPYPVFIDGHELFVCANCFKSYSETQDSEESEWELLL
jgi:ribosome-binding protein aMBF1 (putative translation factor)